MTAVVLAAASALAYGVADFLAGLLSRRVHFAMVGLASQVGATAAVWVALPFLHGAGASPVTLGWGGASGVGGAIGSLLLYRGLGRGQMSVVSPLAAVGSAALPALAGIAFGERPSSLAVVGVVLALPALWLVARPAGGARTVTAAAVGDGLLAGVGFAILFIGLDRAGDRSGLWPVAAGSLVSLAVQVGYVAARRPVHAPDLRRARPDLLAAGGVGVISVAATVFYFLATHTGLLTVVAVLSSLYPAVTVVLAALVLHERTQRSQRTGLLLATVAVTLITIS